MKNNFFKLLLMVLLIGGANMLYATTWDKVFTQSDKVKIQKVTFKNRYGITLVGDLYIPKNAKSKKLSAIAISGPFGAVKEQASGFYAQTLAESGFVVLAFDPSLQEKVEEVLEMWQALISTQKTLVRQWIF